VEGFGEVRDVGGLVLAAKEDLVFGDFAAAGGGDDFLDEGGDACCVVLNGEGGFENVAMVIADEADVFALGVVESDADDLAGISGAFEDGANKGVGVTID
jgi:hypothetical protein